MSAFEMGYNGGYAPEKIIEGVLLSKGVGAVSNVVRSSTTTITITNRLQRYVIMAASEVDALGNAAFAPRQFTAIQRNPSLRPMFRGNRIDVMARYLIRNDSNLFHLNSNYSRGADFVNPATGQWWDMTTPGSWTMHVRKYGPGGTLLRTQ